MLTKEEIASVFKCDIVGRDIIYLESAASTNDSAFEIGRNRPDPEGIVVVAEMQTKGRGRLGRSWISPAGVNLYFTVLLTPSFTPEQASILTLAVPVAIASAIRTLNGLPAQIKWPNDIIVNGKKAGGVLIEMKAGKTTSQRLLAIGIGINVNMSPDALPSEIRPLSTSLKMEKGESVSRSELLGGILSGLEHAYKNLLNGNKRDLINEWLRLNCTIGRRVSVRNQDRTISGIADGVNERGELAVRLSSGETEIVRAGDVTILKD
jgi:BirA family biotin operon repressor/biotin-[acetyl-CoA-carboxylase] ligase